MILKQKDLLVLESNSFLNDLEYITESENVYPAVAVPIHYNERLDRDLIHLENFMLFGERNGIDDCGQAIAIVCEENKVPLTNIGFVVNEASLYEDEEIASTANILKENGIPVVVAPISSTSCYYRELAEALELDKDCSTFEESVNLQMYCEGVMDDIKNKVSSGYDAVKNRVSTNIKNAKDFFSTSANATSKSLSNKLASIRRTLSEKMSKLRSASGDAKVFLQRQVDKLKSAYQAVKDKLSSAKGSVSEKLTAGANDVKDLAGKVGDNATSVVNKVKNKAKNIKSKFNIN